MLDFEIINRGGIGAFPAVLARILPDLARMTRRRSGQERLAT
jgi:hypothetical protein